MVFKKTTESISAKDSGKKTGEDGLKSKQGRPKMNGGIKKRG